MQVPLASIGAQPCFRVAQRRCGVKIEKQSDRPLTPRIGDLLVTLVARVGLPQATSVQRQAQGARMTWDLGVEGVQDDLHSFGETGQARGRGLRIGTDLRIQEMIISLSRCLTGPTE